jgi:hypothetical protein
MVGEPQKTTVSGRPRERNPKHWWESQKIFARKGSRHSEGHRITKKDVQEQKRRHRQRHFRGFPEKTGMTKKERKSAERRMKHREKMENRRKNKSEYIVKLKKKLKGIYDLKRRKKIEKRIKKLEGSQ